MNLRVVAVGVWCLGRGVSHCGQQTQRFSSICRVQERGLRIWHQVIESCPLLAVVGKQLQIGSEKTQQNCGERFVVAIRSIEISRISGVEIQVWCSNPVYGASTASMCG